MQSYNPLDALVVAAGALMESLDAPVDSIDPGLGRLLERLATSVRLVLVVDVPDAAFPGWKTRLAPVLASFEHVVTRDDLGAPLPGDGAFEAILDLLEVPPDEIGWIDDDPATLHAAATVGFRTFEAGPADILADELEPHLNTIPGE